jgi:hypothetical protein
MSPLMLFGDPKVISDDGFSIRVTIKVEAPSSYTG